MSGVCGGYLAFLNIYIYIYIYIYINDLYNAIKFSQSFHYAKDTCLLNIQNIICKINRCLMKDLKEVLFWLNANYIALNVQYQRSYSSKLNTNPEILT